MTKYETVFHLTLETDDHDVYYLLDDGRTWKREDTLTETDNVKVFATSKECALAWLYMYDTNRIDWTYRVKAYPTIEMVCDEISVCTIRIYEKPEV